MSSESTIFIMIAALVLLLITSLVTFSAFSERNKKKEIEKRKLLTSKINRLSHLEDIFSKIEHVPHTNISELSIKIEMLDILQEMSVIDPSEQISTRVLLAQNEVDSIKGTIDFIQFKGVKTSSNEKQAMAKIKLIQELVRQISRTSVKHVDLMKYFNAEKNRLMNGTHKVRISFFEKILFAAESKNELGSIAAIGSKLITALQSEGSDESLSLVNEVKAKVEAANSEILAMQRKKIVEQTEKERDEDDEIFNVKKVW